MPLRTVFVTNRNIERKRSRGNSLFGDGFNKDDTYRIALAFPVEIERPEKQKVDTPGRVKHILGMGKVKKTYELCLIDKDQEKSKLKEIVEKTDNTKPWVVYIHGNNQTLDKNLNKSRIIQDQYDVNMVVFSWPSRTYSDKMLPLLVSGALLNLHPVGRGFGGFLMQKGVKNKIKQYQKAREAAKKTVLPFINSFSFLKDNLFVPLLKSHAPHTCLLVHSLGHKVIRDAIESGDQKLSGYTFKKVLLHQADELNEEHASWIADMPMANSKDVYITKNRKDSVLFMSGIVNSNLNPSKAFTRLGNRKDDQLNSELFNYLDFTGMDGVGFAHGIVWDENISKDVLQIFRPILTGTS